MNRLELAEIHNLIVVDYLIYQFDYTVGIHNIIPIIKYCEKAGIDINDDINANVISMYCINVQYILDTINIFNRLLTFNEQVKLIFYLHFNTSFDNPLQYLDKKYAKFYDITYHVHKWPFAKIALCIINNVCSVDLHWIAKTKPSGRCDHYIEIVKIYLNIISNTK